MWGGLPLPLSGVESTASKKSLPAPARQEEGDMSAVLLAVFNDYEAAERMRVTLFRDGFPTDRVHLTCSRDLGCAGVEPAASPHAKCLQYFRTLLKREDEKELPEILAQRIDNGAATITVLPRGAVE